METYFQLEITKGKVTRVSEEDWDYLCTRRLSAHQKTPGAKFYARVGSTPLHRFISDAPIGMHVDHINCDTLDNRRENLRVCTQAENNRNMPRLSTNTSGYKGVSREPGTDRWRARPGKKHLGIRDTKEEAYQLYCETVKARRCEFSRTA